MTAKRISSSVHAIGWRTADDHREQRQGDHDEQERQVAEPRIAAGRRRRHADRHVAEHARDADQAEDREDPPERAADEDQQQQRTDRVRGDPFAGKSESEQARP
jgi:hypothetical protein